MESFIIWTVGLLLALALIYGAGWAVVALAGFLFTACVWLISTAWMILLACLFPVAWLLDKAGIRHALARVDRRPRHSTVIERPAPISAPMWDR